MAKAKAKNTKKTIKVPEEKVSKDVVEAPKVVRGEYTQRGR